MDTIDLIVEVWGVSDGLPRTSDWCTWKRKSGFRSLALRSPVGPTSCPDLVGLTRAVELLFSGRSMDGREALREGWATEVAEDEAALEAAVARWTDHLRSAPTDAIGLMKRAVYPAFEDDLVEGFQRVALDQIVTVGSHDREEGRQAWLERRPPEFHGY